MRRPSSASSSVIEGVDWAVGDGRFCFCSTEKKVLLM